MQCNDKKNTDADIRSRYGYLMRIWAWGFKSLVFRFGQNGDILEGTTGLPIAKAKHESIKCLALLGEHNFQHNVYAHKTFLVCCLFQIVSVLKSGDIFLIMMDVIHRSVDIMTCRGYMHPSPQPPLFGVFIWSHPLVSLFPIKTALYPIPRE